jgi:uncharacterized protein involved in response to NO
VRRGGRRSLSNRRGPAKSAEVGVPARARRDRRRPLLWTLYISYLFTIAGFWLLALGQGTALPPLVGIHALGARGIGLITAGMMARVSLGHSGRRIANLPRGAAAASGLVLAAAIVRVVFPIMAPGLQSSGS